MPSRSMEALDSHDQAQRLSVEAANARHLGERERALDLFSQAADLERAAFETVPLDKPKTRVTFAISAAALLYKSGRFDDTEVFAYQLLASDTLGTLAKVELKEILECTADARAISGAGFDYSNVAEVCVSLRGGEVGSGTAPLDTAVHYLSGFSTLVNRAAEWEARAPFRKQGPPNRDVRDVVQARATQPASGSFRFSIRLVEPLQPRLIRVGNEIQPLKVAQTFMSLMSSVRDGDREAVTKLIDDKEYRTAILKLIRNIMPIGRSVKEVEVALSGEPSNTVLFLQDPKRGVNDVIREDSPAQKGTEAVLAGTLRALHLDNKWLEVTVDGKHEKIMTKEVEVDDVLGPMVNRKVKATVLRLPGKLPLLKDIELSGEEGD